MKHTVSIFGCVLAVVLTACQAKPEYDTTLSSNLQDEREKLTTADAYYFGDINKTATSNAIAVTFLSSGMSIAYDGLDFSGYAGNGYAFDLIFNSSDEKTLAAGTYVLDTLLSDGSYSYAQGTIDPENSTVSIVYGGNATTLALSEANVKVVATGGGYTVDIAATAITGVAVEAHFAGEVAFNDIYAFREPAEATSFNGSLAEVDYEASELNYEDWVTDVQRPFLVERYLKLADEKRAELDVIEAENPGLNLEEYELYADSAAIYNEAYAALKSATDPEEIAELEEILALYQNAADVFKSQYVETGYDKIATQYNEYLYFAYIHNEAYGDDTKVKGSHSFLLLTEQGDVVHLDVLEYSLSDEFHAVLPDGTYAVDPGVYYVTSTENYRAQSNHLYGSYIEAADGNWYYIADGEVEVTFNGAEVATLQFKGVTANGSAVDCSYSK